METHGKIKKNVMVLLIHLSVTLFMCSVVDVYQCRDPVNYGKNNVFGNENVSKSANRSWEAMKF